MKKYSLVKNYFLCVLIACPLLFSSSCSIEDGDLIKATAKNGPFIKFLNKDHFPPSSYDGSISSWSFTGKVEDPSNNVASYELYVGVGTGTPVTTGIILNSFPNELSITGSQVLSTLNKTDNDFTGEVEIRFYGKVTGKDGVIAKDFPNERNVSTDFINWNVGTFSAYRFIITFKY